MLPFLLAAAAVAAEETDDDLVVEGDPSGASGYSGTSIPVDERLPPTADLGDAVARAPGTSVRRLGGLGDFAAVSLRGSALRQVEVHLDGTPLNPDGSAAFDLSSVPLRAFSHVLVWRGAGPAWMPSAPVGGAVDLLTTPDARAPLDVRVSGGSWSTGTLQASGAAAFDRWEVLAGGQVLTTQADFWAFDDNGTGGVRTDDRITRREYNDKSQASLLLRVRTRGRPSRWTALALGAARDEGLPGPLGARDPYGRFRTGWGLASVDGTVPTATGQARLRGWVQGRDEHLTPPAGDPTRERQGQAGLQADVRSAWGPWTLGAVTRGRLESRAATAGEGAAHRTTWATSVDTSWRPTSAFSAELVALTQGLWTRRSGSDLATSWMIAPRGALVYQPSGRWSARAAGGRTWRPPDFLELFGDRGPLRGRPDLRPERGWFADAGLRRSAGDSGVEIALFVNQLRDRIVFVQTGQRAVVPVNVGRSGSAGVEAAGWLQASWADLRGQITVNPTWVRSDRTGQDKRQIPRVPQLTTVIDAGLRWGDRARIGASLDFVAGNAWDEANLSWAAPRLLAGAQVAVQPNRTWPTLVLEARNLTNRMAQVGPRDVTDPDAGRAVRPLTDFVGYPLPGRTVLLTLRWTAPSRSPAPTPLP